MIRSKQLICVLIVALGLLISGSGMVISFIVFPPIPQFVYDPGPFTTPEEDAQIGRHNRVQIAWSMIGIYMLVFGTSLQLAGTVWQAVLLARKK